MSTAGRQRVVDLVAAVVPPTAGAPFVHIGRSAAPLEEHVGATRLFEVVNSDADVVPIVGMTRCDTPLWAEEWLIRVRYEAAGPHVLDGGDLDALIAEDTRAIIKALRVASAWSDVLENLLAGHRFRRPVAHTGEAGDELARIAEIPIRARFYE